jgi:hypothetical protein
VYSYAALCVCVQLSSRLTAYTPEHDVDNIIDSGSARVVGDTGGFTAGKE